MKHVLVFFLISIPFFNCVSAQTFIPFPNCDFDNGSIESVLCSGDSIVFTGYFSEFSGEECEAVVSWKNNAVLRIVHDRGPLISSASFYNDLLVVTGFNGNVNDIPQTRGIAAWNGNSWEALGLGGGSGNNHPKSLCEWNGRLYAGRTFSSIGGLEVQGFASYADGEWQAEESVFGIANGPYAMTVFQDELWGVGVFVQDIDGNQLWKVGRFDGEHWHSVNGGVIGTGNCLLADEDEGVIYIGHDGEAAQGGEVESLNGVSYYDGSNWHAVGEYNDLGPGVYSLIQYRNQLYAGGIFEMDTGTCSLAYFDGFHWQCVEGSGGEEYPGFVKDMVVYQDTLVVVGDFPDYAGFDVHGKIKYYMHPDSVQWGVPDGIDEKQSLQVKVYPNPSKGKFHIHVDQAGSYSFELRTSNGQVLQSPTLLKELITEVHTAHKGVLLCAIYQNGVLVESRRLIMEE